ncbi:MAG: hypothetical protein C5B43_04570 [Verrucomicrobia bacterium]|nr:MAG: hypothetical protein C5B43_04570 [Verrucomicrobiota bacterium]
MIDLFFFSVFALNEMKNRDSALNSGSFLFVKKALFSITMCDNFETLTHKSRLWESYKYDFVGFFEK